MNELIVGIDLGTTNSEIAIVEQGKVTLIEDENGQQIIPSFVSVAENGDILVGETAKNQYLLYPERTIKSIKRRMGEDVTVTMAGQSYTPQEISAIILRRLKAIAENYTKKPVNKAVITVPAYFSDAQRQATRDAGKIAGLEVVRIINEPTAAALTYENNQTTAKHILVYDLGGGTFDVSIVNLEQNVVEVIASHGNNHLGGDDFDQEIINHIVAHLQEKYEIDITVERQAMARITRAAEQAKLALSDKPFVLIEEEFLYEHHGKPIHLSLELERHLYEDMIVDYIDETLDAIHVALEGAHLTASDIDKILLVGGSTRTPLIINRLREEFGLQPHGEINPDLCVAAGAAIQAARIAGQDVSTVLVDITPYTFGTSALGELNGQPYMHRFIPVILKNTALPTTKTEVFYTVNDNQQAVLIDIYQGESPDALQNTLIGNFSITELSQVPEGNPIILTMALDVNGILHVSAKEKITGLNKSITIDNATSHFEQEALAEAKMRVGNLFHSSESNSDDVVSSDEEEQAIVQAKELIAKAQSTLATIESSDDKEDIINQIERLNQAIAEQDRVIIAEASEQLADILFYLDN